MKKFLLLVILFISIPVYAKENKLYFTENDNRIYYESKWLDENVFMKHMDMIPGTSYTDELIIENGTNTTYTLFFKVFAKEQSDVANELLENIDMTILLNDQVIYEGKATGLDYANNGINLQDVISLGEFNKSSKSKMVVNTTLSKEYNNIDNTESSYIDWTFYAQYEDSEPIEIVKVPSTMKNSLMPLMSLIIMIIGIGVICYAHKKED